MTADSKRSQVEKLISQNGDFGTLALPQLPVSVSNGTEKSQSAQMRVGWGRGHQRVMGGRRGGAMWQTPSLQLSRSTGRIKGLETDPPNVAKMYLIPLELRSREAETRRTMCFSHTTAGRTFQHTLAIHPLVSLECHLNHHEVFYDISLRCPAGKMVTIYPAVRPLGCCCCSCCC